MTRCIMKTLHYKAWKWRMQFERHALEELAREKGATLRLAGWRSLGLPHCYYVFPPDVTSVPYNRIYDRFETRRILESL